ncbi:hypothetical protein GQ44DRAFT_732572 [Phaeosphaeriaceae sp. PMI808]|nr:hypothetical protein GQ44DRAFT_732572 [Phaeosphaeriaceae sp. PMI808]
MAHFSWETWLLMALLTMKFYLVEASAIAPAQVIQNRQDKAVSATPIRTSSAPLSSPSVCAEWSNWIQAFPEPELLWIGNYSTPNRRNDCRHLVNYNVSYFDKYVRDFYNLLGVRDFGELWYSLLLNASIATSWTSQYAEKNYSHWYWQNPTQYNPAYDEGIYLAKKPFCQSMYPLRYSAGDENAIPALVITSRALCKPTSSYGWPSNWTDGIDMVDDDHIAPTAWPYWRMSGVVKKCYQRLNATELSCSSYRINLRDTSGIGSKSASAGGSSAYVSAISRSCFCKQMNTYSECLSGVFEDTFIYLLLDKLCEDVNEFVGLPKDWKYSILVMNSSYSSPDNFISWPKCANTNGCASTLNSTATKYTHQLCQFNETKGFCDSITRGFDVGQFCSSSNWTSLLKVQTGDLPQWSQGIQISSSTPISTNTEPHRCPSTSSKLVAFAAVNVAMAILTPIIGRRDFMKKISFGKLGHRGSTMWVLTGPVTAVLHILSNAIAAIMIKKTAGFEGVNAGQLTLLWCTRPRLVWLIVALLPFQSSSEMYFSVTCSALIAELVLQSIGGYYMGVATNFARRQRFYSDRHLLKNAPGGRDAMTMYAGSIMLLSIIILAIATCIWTLLDLTSVLTAITSAIQGVDRKAKRLSEECASHTTKVKGGPHFPRESFQAADLKTQWPELEHNMVNALQTYVTTTMALGDHWKRLESYVTEDRKALSEAEKAEQVLQKTNESSAETSAGILQAYATWYDTPTWRLEELGKLVAREDWLPQDFDIICSRWIDELRDALRDLEFNEPLIPCLDKVIANFDTWVHHEPEALASLGRDRRNFRQHQAVDRYFNVLLHQRLSYTQTW